MANFYNNIPEKVNYGQALFNKKLQFQLQNRNVLHFFPGEYLIYHSLNAVNNEADPIANCWVITNMRFAKLENARSVTDVPLGSLQRCSHQKNGIFKWDKVEFHLKNGSRDTAGLADSRHVAWVVSELNGMISGRIPPQWNQQPVQPVQQPVMVAQPVQPVMVAQPIRPVQPVHVQPVHVQPVQPVHVHVQPVFNAGIGGIPVLRPGNTVMIRSQGSNQNIRAMNNGAVDAQGGNGPFAKWIVGAGRDANTFTLNTPVTNGFLRIVPGGKVDAGGVQGGPNTYFQLAPSNIAGCVGIIGVASGLRLGFENNGQIKAPQNTGAGPHGSFTFLQG